MEPRPGYTQRHEVKVTQRHGQGHSYQSQSSMEQRPGYTETQGQGHIETTSRSQRDTRSRSHRDMGSRSQRQGQSHTLQSLSSLEPRPGYTQRHKVEVTQRQGQGHKRWSIIISSTCCTHSDQQQRDRQRRDKGKPNVTKFHVERLNSTASRY